MIEIGWRMRNALRWSPPLWAKPVAGRVSRVLSDLSRDQRVRFEQINRLYNLSDWESVLTVSEYIENLYVLDVCEHYFSSLPVNGLALDVGTRNGVYLLALHAFFNTPWEGIELDAYRRYWNLCTREVYAGHALRIRPECRYRAGSVADLRSTYNLVTWFLPFVFSDTLDPFGLPRRYFDPQSLLEHVHRQIQSGGHMIVVNQGQVERQAQAELFEKAGIKAQSIEEIESIFSRFKKRRFAWIVEK